MRFLLSFLFFFFFLVSLTLAASPARPVPACAVTDHMEPPRIGERKCVAGTLFGPYDRTTGGKTFFGLALTTSTLGVALPRHVMNAIVPGGKLISSLTSPAFQYTLQCLKVQISCEPGKCSGSVEVPIVDIGPAPSTGKGLDITFPTARRLGLINDRQRIWAGAVQYKIVADDSRKCKDLKDAGERRRVASNSPSSADLASMDFPEEEEALGSSKSIAVQVSVDLE